MEASLYRGIMFLIVILLLLNEDVAQGFKDQSFKRPKRQEVLPQNKVIDELRHNLLATYDPNSRPRLDHTQNVTAELSFTPLHLTDVDEMRGLLDMEFWITLSWFDNHLQWEPSKYQGLKLIEFADHEIWKPDIAIYESRGSQIDAFSNVYLTVNSWGNVKWNAPGSSSTICNLKYDNYPIDKQICTLTFGSWSHHGDAIDLLISKTDNPMQILQNSNPHWKITKIEGVRRVIGDDDNSPLYPILVYTIEVERIGGGEEDMIAIPRTMSILLILSMFFLPTTSTTKFALGCTSAIIQTCLIVLTSWNVPTMAALPCALRSIKCSFTLTILAIIVEVVIMGLIGCNTCSPPMWITSILESPIAIYALCACGIPSLSSSTQIDGTRAVESTDPRKKDWLLVASFCDKLSFIIFIFLFLVAGAFW